MWWSCNLGHSWRAAVYSRTLGGNGCPGCSRYGFKRDRPAYVYFLEHTQLSARKVGVTNEEARYLRIRGFEASGWEVLFLSELVDGERALIAERDVLSWIRRDLGLPPILSKRQMRRLGGHTETFAYEQPPTDEVVAFIQASLERTALGPRKMHGSDARSQ